MVGLDKTEQNTVWVGGSPYVFSTAYADASLSSANGTSATGSFAGGSLIWPYRSGGKAIAVPLDSVFSLAKNADVFLDTGIADDGITQTASMLTIKSGKAIITPFNLPAIDPSAFLEGVCINAKGVAVIDVVSFPFGPITKRPTDPLSRRALWNATVSPLSGTGRNRRQALISRLKFSTTVDSPSGFYYVSSTGLPVPLGLPTNAFAVNVLAINDQGIAVGAAGIGDPNNPQTVPCYWDAKGNAFVIPMSSTATFGDAEDINNEGTVVGTAGTDSTQYAAMWKTVSTPEIDLNTIFHGTTGVTLFSCDSIGDDFGMSASGTLKKTKNDIYFFGLQP